MRKIKLFVVLLILFQIYSFSSNESEEGKIFEILRKNEWIREIPELTNQTFVVLDFWATWCAPCISNFPHLNNLSKKYSNKSFVFISITPEKRKIVELFLKRHKVETYIILDATKEIHTKFNINPIPFVIIVNSKDEIIWKGHPLYLTDSILDHINNKRVKISKKSIDENKISSKKIDNNDTSKKINNNDTNSKKFYSLSFSIKQTTYTNMSKLFIDVKDSGIIFNIINKPLCDVLQELLNIKKTRLECNFNDSTNWDLEASIINIYDVNLAKEILKNNIISFFGFKIGEVEKKLEVEKLFCYDSTLLNQNITDPEDYDFLTRTSKNDSLFSSANISLDELCKNFEDLFRIPFINTYQSTSRFNFVFDISNGIDKVRDSLKKNYGLILKKDKSDIKILKITK